MEREEPLYGSFSQDLMRQAFEACMELSDDGFLIVDAEGRIAYINSTYCDYIGAGKEEATGRSVLDFIPTSKMVYLAKHASAPPEINVLHKVSDRQFQDKEHYAIVSRANFSKDGVSQGAVAQIKIVSTTLKLSSILKDMSKELEYYRGEMGRMVSERYSFDRILGISEEIGQVKEMARRAAVNDFSVLITGETGTGKEVFANVVHFASSRGMKPFIRINCAAIPTELMEAELFGYEEGSFTGAKRGGKKGKFELADGGTIFLDEIGELPLFMQAKILRALQEREIERIGGEKPVPVNIRIISATNKDLLREAKAGRFREDLYYRLNVIELKIPSLRSRRCDISLFIDQFLRDINKKYHTDTAIDAEARQMLIEYNWPGNVRELKNTMERSYALSENGIITRFTLPGHIAGSPQYVGLDGKINKLDGILAETERRIILGEIARTNGNLKQAAASLGIHRTTLYKKMDKLGITREDSAGLAPKFSDPGEKD